MRKHMTHAEKLRIEKLIAKGVTDPAKIQEQVFVHADCIYAVLAKAEGPAETETPDAPTPAQRVAAKKKSASKKKAAIDPLS